MIFVTELMRDSKRKDISCLQGMLQVLHTIEEDVSRVTAKAMTPQQHYQSFQENVLAIVNLCGGKSGIIFNDSHDPDSYCIRNRYSHKLRNQGHKENPNVACRIDFENLFRLKALIENMVDISTTVLLSHELVILRKKLKGILWQEFCEDSSYFAEARLEDAESAGDTRHVSSIDNVVHNEYPKLLFRRIKEEIEKLSTLTLTDRHSVYCIARRYVVIGELFHEADAIIPGMGNGSCLSLSRRFIQLRNGFVHFHYHRALLSTAEKNLGLIQESFMRSQQALKQIFSFTPSLLDPVNKDLLQACKACLQDFSQFLRPGRKAKLRNQLLGTVYAAVQLFEVLESHEYLNLRKFIANQVLQVEVLELSNYLETEAAWKGFVENKISISDSAREIIYRSFKDNHPSYLLQLKEDKSLLAAISPAVKDELLALLEKLEIMLLEKELVRYKAEYLFFMEQPDIQECLVQHFDSTVLPDFNINHLSFSNQDIHNLLRKYSRQFAKYGTKVACTISSHLGGLNEKLILRKVKIDSLTNLQKKFISKFSGCDLSEAEREELKREFDFSFDLNPSNVEKIRSFERQEPTSMLKCNPASKYAKLLRYEMDYLVEVNAALSIAPLHRRAIVEHIVTLVGQYVRDIEEQGIAQQIFLTHLARKLGKVSKSLRSKGLAHELFNFDERDFLQECVKHIYPAYQDCAAVSKVLEFGHDPSKATSMLYAEIARSYARLHYFQESIEFYKKALATFRTEQPLDPFTQNSVFGGSELAFMGITQSTAIAIDFNAEMFGISTFELVCWMDLQKLYLRYGYHKEAVEILETLRTRIKESTLLDYQKCLIHSGKIASLQTMSPADIASVISPELQVKYQNLLNALGAQQRPYAIVGIDEKFLFTTVSSIFLGAARAYLRLQDYESAESSFAFSSELLIFEVKDVNIIAINTQQLLRNWVEVLDFFPEQRMLETAECFARDACRNAEQLDTQLLAIVTLYRIQRRKARVSLSALTSLLSEHEKILFVNLPTLKQVYGDDFYNFLEQFYAIQLDYFIYLNDFVTVRSYLQKIERQFYEETGIDLHKTLRNIYPAMLASIASRLGVAIAPDRQAEILQICETFYTMFEAKVGGNAVELGDARDSLIQCYCYFVKTTAEQAINPILIKLAKLYIDAGQAYSQQSDCLALKAALRYFDKGLTCYTRLHVQSSTEYVEVSRLKNICARKLALTNGIDHYKYDRWEQAIESFKMSLQITTLLFAAEPHQELAEAHWILACCCSRNKNYAEARSHFLHAHDIFKKLPGSNVDSIQRIGERVRECEALIFGSHS